METEPKLSAIRQIASTDSAVGTALPLYRDVLGLAFYPVRHPTWLS